MKRNDYSCASCAFVREGKIKDRYSHKTGFVTHDGLLCRLYPPRKDTCLPVKPTDICTRWTDKRTLAQPLAHLAPAAIITAPTPTTPDGEDATENGKEVE